MPVVVRAYELDFTDNRVPEPERAKAIETQVRLALKRLVLRHRVHVFNSNKVEKDSQQLLMSFLRWAAIASMEIARQEKGLANYGRKSVAEWQFESDLSPLRRALDADFALFVQFRDTRETTGRALGLALIGAYTLGNRIGVGCVADLRDGRMVWCDVGGDGVDLSVPEEAQYAVEDLLKTLDALPYQPPLRNGPM